MQNAAMEVTLSDGDSSRVTDTNLPCSLSLGEVDYLNFYLEQRVADHAQRSEHANRKALAD